MKKINWKTAINSISIFIISIIITTLLPACGLFVPNLALTPNAKLDFDNKYPIKVGIVLPEDIKKITYKNSDYAKIKIGQAVCNLFETQISKLFSEAIIFYGKPDISNDSSLDMLIFVELTSVNANRSDETFDGKIPTIKIRHYKYASLSILISCKSIMGKSLSSFSVTSSGDDFWTDSPTILLVGDSLQNKIYKNAFSKALEDVGNQIENKLSTELGSYFVKIQKKRAMPSDLVATISIDDKSSLIPNSVINAGEDLNISVNLINKGNGTAYSVNLIITSNISSIDFPSSILVGNMPPGEKREIEIPLKAGLALDNGTTTFLITATESRGFNSKPYKLRVKTEALEKPQLSIVRYLINDGRRGFASGNGNGIPENGETIELVPFIRNSGEGKALKVSVKIVGIDSQIEVIQKSSSISEILPGQIESSSLVFHIPRTYSERALKIDLRASDVLNVSTVEESTALNTICSSPSLAYKHQLIDANGNGLLENGEQADLEIIPVNKGEMEARDITLSVTCDDLLFNQTRHSISRIMASEIYNPVRFSFTVPRKIDKDSISLRVAFEQRDFKDLTDIIHIPIHKIAPKFHVKHHVLDANGNGIIEKGESIDLIVSIVNRGELDAEDVNLNINIQKEGILSQSNHSTNIGRLAAGFESSPQRYRYHISRKTESGILPIKFSITQKDFHPTEETDMLNISEEKPEILTVAPNEVKNITTVPASTRSTLKIPPMIFIATPKDQVRVARENEIIQGVVGDDKGLANIQITINGQRLETPRGILVNPLGTSEQTRRDFNFTIPLEIGRNEIIVTAFDIDNLSSSESITIFRESDRGEIYAAIIGINRYKFSSEIPNLKYARNDAESFAEYIRKAMKLDNQHLFELYDDQATKRNIESLLGTKLRRKAQRPEDTVIIFFAGHGAPESDTTSNDPDGISKYILSYDSHPNDLFSSAIAMELIAKIFSRIRAERIIFIADSCYSGDSGGRTILASNRRANISDAFLQRIAQSGKGRIILTSCSAQEVSQESDQLRHGYFTYYLLEGLSGKADISQDGEIDIDEIYRYLNKHVPAATQNTQHPVKKGEAEGRVIIGHVN